MMQARAFNRRTGRDKKSAPELAFCRIRTLRTLPRTECLVRVCFRRSDAARPGTLRQLTLMQVYVVRPATDDARPPFAVLVAKYHYYTAATRTSAKCGSASYRAWF